MDLWSTLVVQTKCKLGCMPGPGRPKMTMKKLTENDCDGWKLSTVDPQKGTPGEQV